MNINVEEVILYVVSYGKVDSSPFGGSKSLYVVATDYNNAAEKALKYICENEHKESVLTSDGSINPAVFDDCKITSVRICSDKIVW